MEQRFLLDGMLGRLCRKLRMLGCDCELAGAGRSPYLLLDAESSGRTAVTAATRHLDRRGPLPVVLGRTDTNGRIAELLASSGKNPQLEPFTRCLECNAVLEAESAASVEAEVPEYIREHFDRYHRCPSCRRIYWEGSHYEEMTREVEELEKRIREG